MKSKKINQLLSYLLIFLLVCTNSVILKFCCRTLFWFGLLNYLLSYSHLTVQVRLHLLTAVMKCFFKRPPETQKALGAALAAGLADFHQV